MLELRPNCECCDRDLSVDDPDVFICTFECTWCASCARSFEFVCPNCSGNLSRRPIRPAQALVKFPASTTRVVKSGCLEQLASNGAPS